MKKNYLEYKDFLGTVAFDSENEVFFGKIAEVPDLVSFEGHSVRTLKKAFREAVDDYIYLCQCHKRPIIKSFKGSFNIRIKPELHRMAYRSAMKAGQSLNQFVQSAIENQVLDAAS